MGRANVSPGWTGVLLMLATALLPVGAAAQILGQVTTRDGRPMEAVAIEAWSTDRRVAATMTDDRGRFFFIEAVASQTTSLRVSALGFEAVRVAVDPGVTRYQIQLDAQPIALEGLVVSAGGDICTGKEDKRARSLWESARTHYQGAMDTLGIATYLAEADTVVAKEKLGPLQLPELALSQRSSSSLRRFSWARRVKRNGYAFKVKRTDADHPYDSWVYAPLEADFTPHFVQKLFGDENRFIVLDEADDGWMLRFCPKDDDKPFIRGTMALATDTTLQWVEWAFQTPEPLEHAGGRVSFAPVTRGPNQTYPLPLESLVWWQMPDGNYFQRYQRYENWIVAPGDSVPQLPFRRVGRRNPK
ncbi:MAG: hypothetical protein BMS9Abin29_2600 [Gemmatimonadota bacterium]|nr:MAG: hypothetical protein BMS9Abin29_2600 [Gemmatimonadota bacterium]